MKFKKLTIIAMFLLIISVLSVQDINSYAGLDDLIALGIGCISGGFWNKMWGGGECGPYVPPEKGNCQKCSENPLQECSEYQCNAIGRNCKFQERQCLDFTKDDTSSPMIINCEKISRYEEYQQGKRSAIHNKEEMVCNFGEIVKGRGVVAVLTTDEDAICRFDVELGKDYKNMKGFFEIFNDFSTKHILKIDPGEKATEEAMKKCENSNCRLFIRCADVAGNEMNYDYAFIFDVEGAGEDTITPPKIEFTSVESGYIMKFQDSNLDFGLLADDISGVFGCRYSKEDKEYDLMENELDCEGDRPAACTTTLTNIKDGQENKFYFRCKDKKGNADKIGTELIINGGILLGMQVSISEPVTRTSKISVITSGGSDDNNAYCFYKLDGDYVLFDNTGGSNHEQELRFIPKPGNYNVKIGCGDSAGDIVEETKNLQVEAIPLDVALLNKIIDKQKVTISVQTSNGEKNGEADCNLFDDNNINHKYGDIGSFGLENLNENKHSVEINELQNGHYDWSVVCSDISDNENYVLVSFDINTPNLDMEINPPSGTTLEGFNVRVTITTTRGVDGEGNSVCKIKAPENGFIDKDQFEGDDIENGKKSDIHIINLPSATGLFGQTNNVYYIVCRDDAGKTNGQIVSYSINFAESDLKFGDFKLDNKAELKTDKINPIFSFVTTGGKNLDGEADCDVECSLNENKVYGSSYNTNSHAVQFNNLRDGSYNCKITCKDPNFAERGAQEVSKSKSFVVETPDLVIVDVKPVGNVEKRNLRLIVETSGGVKGDGTSFCYYVKNLVDDFRIGNKIDITRKDIEYVYWAYIISLYLEPISNTKKGHIKFIDDEVNLGENILYVQCKDSAGKLAPKDGPLRVIFNVV